MTMFRYILGSLFLCLTMVVLGQNSNCSPTFFCTPDMPICQLSDLNGLQFRSPSTNAQGLYWCSSVENIVYFKFFATSQAFRMKITPSNCQGNNGGIQAGIFEDGCGANQPPVLCVSPAVEQPLYVYMDNMDIGRAYVLSIDGWAGNICDVTIELLYTGPNIQPAITGTGIQPRDTLCIGARGHYAIPFDSTVISHTWSLSPNIGNIVHANPMNPSNEIIIDWIANGLTELCVTRQRSNQSIAETVCTSITIGNTNPTYLILPQVCEGDCNVFRGITYCNPGGYTILPTLQDQNGCDSTFMIFVPSKANGLGFKRDTLFCENQLIVYRGDSIRQAFNKRYVLPNANYLGCDSTIQYSVWDERPLLNFGSTVDYCPGNRINIGVQDRPWLQYQWSPSAAFSCDTCATTSIQPSQGQIIQVTYSASNCSTQKQVKFVPNCLNAFDTIAMGMSQIRCLNDPIAPTSDWIDSCADVEAAVRFTPINPRCISYFGEGVGTDTLCFIAKGPNNVEIPMEWYVTVLEDHGFMGPRPAPIKIFNVFPNPVAHRLHWKSQQPLSQIMLYNTQGLLVFQEKPADVFGSIEVAHLPKGVYYIVGSGASGALQQMVVVQ